MELVGKSLLEEAGFEFGLENWVRPWREGKKGQSQGRKAAKVIIMCAMANILPEDKGCIEDGR